MKVKAQGNMANEGMKMLMDMIPALLGAKLQGKPTPTAGQVDISGAASKLGSLCTSQKGGAPKGTLRDGDELKQQQSVEVAKLKNQHLQDSKMLDGEKTSFEANQKAELATFEKAHGKDKDVVAKRMKLVDKQAAEKGKFEKNFAAKKADLTKKYQEKYAHQTKWHSMQKKELEAKHAPVAKHDPVKVAKASYPIIDGVVQIPAIHC